jgi:hypothetical protein
MATIKPSVPPEQPYLLDGGEEKRRREAKEDEAVSIQDLWTFSNSAPPRRRCRRMI